MSWRATAVLVVVLAILGTYVYFGELRQEQSPGAPVDDYVWEVDSAGVQIVEVTELESGASVTLVRADDQTWRIKQPLEAEADSPQVQSVVGRLTRLRSIRALDPQTAGDPATYGLREPKYRLRLVLKEGREQALYVGDLNPSGSAHYVQADEDPAIYLVSNSLINDLTHWIESPPQKPTPTLVPSPSPTME